jgi:hypothetical protein
MSNHPSRPKYEIVVHGVTALAVAEGYYPLDEARIPLRLGAYGLLREAKQHLIEVAQAEGEKRGLVLDPWYLPKPELGPRYVPEALRLIRPEDVAHRTSQRTALAHVKVKRIAARPLT